VLTLGWLIGLVGALVASPVSAHEMRPGYLEVREVAPHQYHVVWKHPVASGEVGSWWGLRRHQFFGAPDPGAGGTGTTMPGANGISSTAVTFVTKCRVSPKQEVGSPTFSS
jgi:hypothetical protein